MTQDQIKTNIIAVANTLNQITIQGKDNMNRLLGCIMMLENIAKAFDAPPEISLEEVPDEQAR